MKVEKKDRGWKITTDTGRVVYLGEYGHLNANDGVIYLDINAFNNNEGVCYIPEGEFSKNEFESTLLKPIEDLGLSYDFALAGYTRKDLENLLKENESKINIKDLFYSLDWAYPETVLECMEETYDYLS